MTAHPLVELEDALAEELVLAALGVADPPRVDDRYEIVALLGRGARGVVCRAVDLRLDREVALKLYPPFEDPRWAAELAREGKALARLDHAHVVRVFDVSSGALRRGPGATPVHYLSMELVVGRSLRVLLGGGELDLAARLRLLREVADALDAAHALGVVHRDMKPENVVVDTRHRARVVDFGLARVGGNAVLSDVPALDGAGTAYGRVAGTPEYMAYEARDGRVGPPADQFALAVMAFELLTGEMPYRDGERPIEAPEVALPVAERTLPAGFSRAAFMRALHRDPAKRFATATQFVETIVEPPPAPAGASMDDVVGRPIANGRARVAVAMVALSVAVGAAFVARRPPASGRGSGLADAGHPADATTRTPPVDASVVTQTVPVDAGRACAAARGTWDLLATVDASRLRTVPAGFRSYFRLALAGDGDCDVDAHVQKLGDDHVEGDAGPLHVEPDMIRDDRARVTLRMRDGRPTLEETFALASRTRGRRDYRLVLQFDGSTWTGRIAYLGPNGQPVYESAVVSVDTPDGGAFGFPLERPIASTDASVTVPADGSTPRTIAPDAMVEPDSGPSGTSPTSPP